MDGYSLKDLVEITGAKRRSIQLWADAGIIRALPSTERAGTGVHRLFTREEAIVACVIHAFALRQISIGELQFIAGSIRIDIRRGGKNVEGAIGGDGDTMFVFESWYDSGERRSQATLGRGKEIYAPNRRQEGHMLMAIRLETYLSKLS
jgi:hypothetical protein